MWLRWYAKFDQIPSIRSQNIKQKGICDDSHNCIVNLQKWTCNNIKLDVKVNAYAKFDQILSIPSQDIKQKQNPHDNQRP